MQYIDPNDYLNGHVVAVKLNNGELIRKGDPREHDEDTMASILVDFDFIAKLFGLKDREYECVDGEYREKEMSLVDSEKRTRLFMDSMPAVVAMDADKKRYFSLTDLIEWHRNERCGYYGPLRGIEEFHAGFKEAVDALDRIEYDDDEYDDDEDEYVVEATDVPF